MAGTWINITLKDNFMKKVILLAAIAFSFAACNNSESETTTTDSTEVPQGQAGVSYGAEGTDTGKSIMSNSATVDTAGSTQDTTLRNGANGLNNQIDNPDSTAK